jgi:cobalt-zinc-cadmium efflux system membrane fusion protein
LAEFVQVEGLLSQLRVEADSSRERAAQAEAELKRVDENQDSVAANVLSEKRKAAITARAEVQQKAIEIQRAEAELAAKKKLVDVLRQGDGGAGVADGMLTLSAALDGVVTSRDAVVGQGIDAGRTVLEIADYSVVQVEGELPESLVSRLDPSHAYSVRIRQNAEGDPVATGTVRFISPIVDEVKRTARVVIDADNPDGRLRDGMYVDAAIVLREEKSAVVVPTSAVLHDGPVAFVFIKDKDTFVKKDIHHGVEDDRVFEVLEGLAPGDVVVTHGAYSVLQIRPKPVVAAATKEPAKDAAPAANEHDADGHKH